MKYYRRCKQCGGELIREYLTIRCIACNKVWYVGDEEYEQKLLDYPLYSVFQCSSRGTKRIYYSKKCKETFNVLIDKRIFKFSYVDFLDLFENAVIVKPYTWSKLIMEWKVYKPIRFGVSDVDFVSLTPDGCMRFTKLALEKLGLSPGMVLINYDLENMLLGIINIDGDVEGNFLKIGTNRRLSVMGVLRKFNYKIDSIKYLKHYYDEKESLAIIEL